MPTPANSPLLTAELADQARRLLLFARWRVEGLFLGDSKSLRRGTGSDFLQHRQYFPGDNSKYLDWRVLGRTERLVIREYEELSNLEVHVLVDHSASMGFAGAGLSKWTVAQQAAILLLYVAHLQKDPAGLSMLGAELRHYLPPAGGTRQLQRASEVLVGQAPAGDCDWEAACRQVRARMKRRALVLVLSDFMGEPEAVGKALAMFRARKCDVLAIRLLHPEEMTLLPSTMTRFVDLEDGSASTVDPLLLREDYQAEFARHQSELRKALAARGITLMELQVLEGWEAVLAAHLRQRAVNWL